jgi:hypothetical protein
VSPEPSPRVDEHIVAPETREEIVRGERMEALPANPPHAERHTDLDYVTRGHVAPGYVVAADLLTRAGPNSDFATDVCVRKVGIDPETGGRYLEELAFEVVAEQSLRHITVRAEDLATRGVRRIIVVFVKRSEVAEWSQAERRFVPLPLDGMLEDPTLIEPIPIRALLDAASADNAVAAALRAKDTPWLVQREQDVSAHARSEALLLMLRGRGLHPSDAQRRVIKGCTDSEEFERWLFMAGRVNSIDELLG